MEPDDPIYVTSRVVGCDGGGGSLGHPLVYLKIKHEGEVVCPYCSRHFILEDGAKEAPHH